MKNFTTKIPAIKWITLSFLFLLFSCKNDKPNTNDLTSNPSAHKEKYQNNESSNTSVKTKQDNENGLTLSTNNLVYSWVDKLNIRNAPNTNSQVISTVDSDDALQFTGEKSDNIETIVLRGVVYDDYWLNVNTPDKKEGWVFGGAVKLIDEIKGNETITEENFNFPYFAVFNTTDWKKISEKDESGGDASIKTTTYKRNKLYMEISKVDVGDYGYSRRYRLMDGKKKLLKERELSFSADMDFKELSETVKDYTKSQPKQYSRSQKLKKHHSQLNSLPLMVNGKWVESNIEKAIIPKTVSIQSFSFGECAKVAKSDSGCSCSFRGEKDNYKSSVFVSDFEDKSSGCIKIDGQLISVTGGNIDNRNEDFDKGASLKKLYSNDQYNVFISGKIDGRNDSGGNTFKGRIVVKSIDGQLLGSHVFWGDCAC